ncbi:MAG: ferrous iron transport protein B [Methanomassiliicoccaceae archaeon]|jgi:ferrous iron transport protein B|nr:ferrous iron transport protein B [Methanomassiliicoccaceae archaeon]
MIRVTLIGQPNAGKSSLFTRMTGVGVIISNYAGTTVEFEEATVVRKGNEIHVHDLPGTHSLSGNSDEERLVMNALTDDTGDVVIVVADASNLEGSMVLCFEAMELGLPVILALNKMDIASKRFDTDVKKMREILDIPVIPVSARSALGIDDLLDEVILYEKKETNFKVRYDSHIEKYINDLLFTSKIKGFDPRGVAVKLLEKDTSILSRLSDAEKNNVNRMASEFERTHGESINVHIARDRYGQAGVIKDAVQKKTARERTFSEKLSDAATAPSTGIPLLMFVLFVTFISFILISSFLEDLINSVYTSVAGDSLKEFGEKTGGELGLAVMGGVDVSIRAILTLVIPFIMLFYVILGILEDSGYLPRAVVLLDRTMHRLGLHGGAFIPMMVGIGCSVPAILATRVVASKRERLILSTIIVMAIPCSAQLAIIMGATGKYAGILAAFVIFLMLSAMIFIIGILMNRWMKYEPTNLAMEMPDLVMPSARNVAFKTWDRCKDFFIIAFPLLIIGSIILEVLLHFGALDAVVEPFSFITVTMLGLPPIVIIAFIVGIVRKEMALGMLFILAGLNSTDTFGMAGFMSPDQFLVFGVVMSIYFPCLAVFAVLWKEFGIRNTAMIALTSLAVALLAGTAFNAILSII